MNKRKKKEDIRKEKEKTERMKRFRVEECREQSKEAAKLNNAENKAKKQQS